MSDLRLTASCVDCVWWASGTSALAWTGEHVDIYPTHRVTVTRSGDLEVVTISPEPDPAPPASPPRSEASADTGSET